MTESGLPRITEAEAASLDDEPKVVPEILAAAERARGRVLSDDCVFCDRLRTRQFDYSDNHAVAFQPLNPVVPGHFLVIPRVHISDFMEDAEIAGRTLACASWIAKALGVESANVITSAGAAATQTVFHLHVHVVPRREGDGLHLPWTGQQATPEPDLEEVFGAPRPMCPDEGCTGSIRPDGSCTRGLV